MTEIINNFAIGGYRSFGSVQYFPSFKKINLFIGRNNSGKSNILRYINNFHAPSSKNIITFGNIDRHLPNGGIFITGTLCDTNIQNIINKFLSNKNIHEKKRLSELIKKIYDFVASHNNQNLCWTLFKNLDKSPINDTWLAAIKQLRDHELSELWESLTGHYKGDRIQHWEPQVIKILQEKPTEKIESHFIPAIRQISLTDETKEAIYSGSGIIKQLAILQNPDALNQELRIKFQEINFFVQSVLDRNDATIEIPHDRSTILVHMDNKVLPLESLGTGVHEVIILAAAATTLNNTVLCIEEPELHLNPILQRKLLKYLSEKTSNQYFITTHSPAIMDTHGAEIYHITQIDGESKVTRVTSDRMKSDACEDLGYHPSDLLQTNCVIWVEGPSDRIYIKYWLSHVAPEFTEGIHYSIMFYGGRLLSHLSGEENENALDEFISLRKLNTRGTIVIDSDKSSPQSKLNNTKNRLITEFNKGPGFAWVTAGREIENYLPEDKLRSGVLSAAPRCSIQSNFGKYDNCLKIKGERGAETQASKTDVAHSITKEFTPNFEIYDLKEKINKLVKFIKESNPATKA